KASASDQRRCSRARTWATASSRPASEARMKLVERTSTQGRWATSGRTDEPPPAQAARRRMLRTAPRKRLAQPVAELDAARDLVGREVLGAVIDDLLRLALGGGDHLGDHHRPAERIGDDQRLRLLHLGEALEAALDLAEGHALAVDLHQVVLAPVEV